MYIISKHKDYYDYYQGIFGIDKTKVYTRKDMRVFEYFESELNPQTDSNTYEFYICGTKYVIHEFKGKFYHTPEEMMELDNILKTEGKNHGMYLSRGGWYNRYMKKRELSDYQKSYDHDNGIPCNENMKYREPILFREERKKDCEVPLLSSYDFHKVLTAEDVYIEVERFLGWLVDNPPLPDKQTNDGKIIGHGFDTKRSFRPNMKK